MAFGQLVALHRAWRIADLVVPWTGAPEASAEDMAFVAASAASAVPGVVVRIAAAQERLGAAASVASEASAGRAAVELVEGGKVEDLLGVVVELDPRMGLLVDLQMAL